MDIAFDFDFVKRLGPSKECVLGRRALNFGNKVAGVVLCRSSICMTTAFG